MLWLVSGLYAWDTHAQWTAHPPDHRKHLEGDTSVKARIELEMDRAGRWLVSNKALPYLHRADSLLRTMQDTVGDPWFRWYRASYHHQMGYQKKFRRDIPVALNHFQLANTLDVERDDSLSVGTIRDAIGVLLMAIGEPRLAETEFRTALALTAGTLEPPHEHLAYHGGHLVRCLAAQGHMAEAWRLWDSLYAEPGHVPSSAALLMEHRAHLHRLALDMDAALEDLLQADSLYQFAPYTWARLSSLTSLARLHLERHESDKALTRARTCVQLAETVGDEAAECGCRVLSAQAHAAVGNTDRAERELLDALAIARANGYMGLARELGDEGSMVHIAGLLKDLYNAQGRTADALRMTTLWAAYKDTLHAMQGREDVMRFDLRKQVVTDSLLKAEAFMLERLAMQEELADQRERAFWITGSGIGAVVLLSMLSLSFARRRRQDQRLARMEHQRLEQEQLIAEFRIRDQVGRDMHDDLGSGLSALRMRSEMAQRTEQDPVRREQFAAMARQANELISNMRQLIWAMDSTQGELDATLDHCIDHARSYLAEHDLRLTVQRAEDLPTVTLTSQQRRSLFMSVKEALHNVVKHAHATTVDLHFRWQHGLRVSIHDNGRGLDIQRNDHLGRGLVNMRERMHACGGSFDIRTDGGTTIALFIPLTNGATNGTAIHEVERISARETSHS